MGPAMATLKYLGLSSYGVALMPSTRSESNLSVSCCQTNQQRAN